ncbi:MAG: hypothetical protein ABI851_14640 [Saprospiraceae bacterium]
MKKILLLFVAFSLQLANSFSQWEDLNLPKSCTVHSIIYSGDKLCVGTTCGIFKNAHALESSFDWKDVSPDKSSLFLNAMTSVNDNLIVSTSKGVYIGKNSGEEWISPEVKMDATIVHQFAVDYETWIYAATDNGIWRSKDSGLNWSLLGLKGQEILCVTILGNQSGYLAGTSLSFGSGLFFGNLYGDEPVKVLNLDGNILKIQEMGDNLFFCGTQNHNPFQDNLYTVDLKSGNSIKSMGFANSTIAELSAKGRDDIFLGFQDRGHFDGEPSLVGIQWSHNYFKDPSNPKWEALNSGLNNLSIHSFLATAENIFAGTEDGLYKLSLSKLSKTYDLGSVDLKVKYINGHLIVPKEIFGSELQLVDLLGNRFLNENEVSKELYFVGNLPKGVYFLINKRGEKIYNVKFINF